MFKHAAGRREIKMHGHFTLMVQMLHMRLATVVRLNAFKPGVVTPISENAVSTGF